jgi:hypothetical protein
MRYEEARQHALGYAAGREDASGVLTADSDGVPARSGFILFAEVFAQGWGDYNCEQRFYMVNAASAYDAWQLSGGRTIFRDEVSVA